MDAASIGSNCIQVRTLYFYKQKWEAATTVAGVLHEPKPHLDTLFLHLEEDNLYQVLREVAMRVTTLRFLNINMKNLQSIGFQDVFVANPLLQGLTLTTSPKERENCITAVVEIIKQCSNLRRLREVLISRPGKNSDDSVQFRYEDLTRIANACVHLRSRRMHVRVFGVTYLS